MIDIKRKLRCLRAKLGLNQDEFARFVDIPLSSYRKKESGKTKFTLDEAYRISKIANKSVEELFFTQ